MKGSTWRTRRCKRSLKTDSPVVSLGDIFKLPRDAQCLLVFFCDESTQISLAHTSKHFRKVIDPKKICPKRYFAFQAIYDDHLKLLKWAVLNWCPLFDDQFLWSSKNQCDPYQLAVENGNSKIVEWLLQQRLPLNETPCFDENLNHPHVLSITAARLGHLHILKILKEKEVLICSCVSGVAARCGDLEMLKWIYEDKRCHSKETILNAAKGGHIEIVQWCARECKYEKRQIWARHISINAANYGHIHIIKWARRWAHLNSWGVLDSEICASAAGGCQLECLQWLRKNGCPWNHSVFAAAIESGDMKIIKWLDDNGCPFDAGDCMLTFHVMRASIEVVEWTRNKGCVWSTQTIRVAINAGRNDIVKWLVWNGCPYDKNYLSQRFERQPDMLAWASSLP